MIDNQILNFAINNGAGVVGMVLMYKLMKAKIQNVENCPYVSSFNELKGGRLK